MREGVSHHVGLMQSQLVVRVFTEIAFQPYIAVTPGTDSHDFIAENQNHGNHLDP